MMGGPLYKPLIDVGGIGFYIFKTDIALEKKIYNVIKMNGDL